LDLSKNVKAFVSWSGGKDSCLALYHAGKDVKPVCLLNMITKDAKRSMTHGLSSEMLQLQAECLGLPLIQQSTTWNTYALNFKLAASKLKEQGVEIGIFGDIDLEEHRIWIEKVCSDIGVIPKFPLWRKDRKGLLEELISCGFEAMIVSLDIRLLEKDYLGRVLDHSFIEYVSRLAIDINGENGEYHTFILDGPIFNKKIRVLDGRIITENNRGLYKIMKYTVEEKS